MTPLRLLLDQMLDVDVARELRDPGFDVTQVSQLGMSQADDAEILEEAGRQQRVFVTLDEHFGDWSVLPLSKHAGVIRVKADPGTTGNVLRLLVPFLTRHSDARFEDTLVILRESGVRWIRTGPAED